jgi:zinc protease
VQIHRILSLSSLLAFALPVARAGQARADVAAPMVAPTVAVEKTKLANGLELILHEDHRTPIVTVNVWYHVGSKDEPQGKNGFAHLFEHVMFQGSKHIPEDAYFRYLERSGATDVNGTTALDRTNYFETVPANRLELALWMESDRMGFLLSHVDQATFESQREVVKNERRQNYENAPYGLVFQYINERLYPANHPYHLLTIGTPKDLDAASLADVKAFFRTWYLPNNATVVVAGDFDKTKTKALVDKYFGPIPGGPLPARSPVPEAKLTSEVRLDVAAGVELPRVYVSWITPKMFAPGDAELDLVARVLSGGKTSRLYKRLVYDMQIAQDVSAYQGSGQLGSNFEIMATAQPGHTAAEMLKAIDEELASLKTAGLHEGELARARTSFTSGLMFDIERDGARANMINTYNQLAGDPGYLPKDLARYATATDAAVLDAAKQWLPKAQRIVTVVTPTKGAPIAGVLNAGVK